MEQGHTSVDKGKVTKKTHKTTRSRGSRDARTRPSVTPIPQTTKTSNHQDAKQAQATSTTLTKRQRKDYDVDLEYQSLLDRKLHLFRNGHTGRTNRVQATINVGIVLGWSQDDVLRVDEKVGLYYRQEQRDLTDEDNGEHAVEKRKMKLSRKMMEALAEQEILDLKQTIAKVLSERGVPAGQGYEDEFAFEQLRILLERFRPTDVSLPIINPGQRTTIIGDLRGDEDTELDLFAPLFLIKAQAALNAAFHNVLECALTSDTSDSSLLQRFDSSLFRQKATYLLCTPHGAASQELLHMLRSSRVGRFRYDTHSTLENKIAAYVGIERTLYYKEKVAILEAMKDLPRGREIVGVVLAVLGQDKNVQRGDDGSRANASVFRKAVTDLGNEGYLVLDYLLRKIGNGEGVIRPEIVVEGEEEEEADSDEEDGGVEDRAEIVRYQASGTTGQLVHTDKDTVHVDGVREGRRKSLIVKLRVSPGQ